MRDFSKRDKVGFDDAILSPPDAILSPPLLSL
jgi:hypothetical protein